VVYFIFTKLLNDGCRFYLDAKMVQGISLIFMALDISGAAFSILSLREYNNGIHCM